MQLFIIICILIISATIIIGMLIKSRKDGEVYFYRGKHQEALTKYEQLIAFGELILDKSDVDTKMKLKDLKQLFQMHKIEYGEKENTDDKGILSTG